MENYNYCAQISWYVHFIFLVFSSDVFILYSALLCAEVSSFSEGWRKFYIEASASITLHWKQLILGMDNIFSLTAWGLFFFFFKFEVSWSFFFGLQDHVWSKCTIYACFTCLPRLPGYILLVNISMPSLASSPAHNFKVFALILCLPFSMQHFTPGS